MNNNSTNQLCHGRTQSMSCVQLFVTPRTVACYITLPMGFPRQEYWSGLPFPPPGDLPDPGIEPESPMSPVLRVGSLPLAPPGKHIVISLVLLFYREILKDKMCLHFRGNYSHSS